MEKKKYLVNLEKKENSIGKNSANDGRGEDCMDLSAEKIKNSVLSNGFVGQEQKDFLTRILKRMGRILVHSCLRGNQGVRNLLFLCALLVHGKHLLTY